MGKAGTAMAKQADGVRTQRMFVDAEIARKWIKLNIDHNRPINSERVNQYARDMQSNKWIENGDTIKFASTGVLLDGQHRLMACLQCGIGFWSHIAFNVPEDAMLTIDRNQPRSTGQALYLRHGVRNYNNVAAVIAWFWRYRDGILVMAERTPSTMESEQILNDHPKIIVSVNRADTLYRKFRAAPKATVGFCHYIFTKQDPVLADLFFDALEHGIGLTEQDAVRLLRERLINRGANKLRMSRMEIMALFFKAWISTRDSKPIRVLKWAESETFPNLEA